MAQHSGGNVTQRTKDTFESNTTNIQLTQGGGLAADPLAERRDSQLNATTVGNTTPMSNGVAKQKQQQQGGGERPKLPRPEGKLPCPRCHSDNTKFCYYNNYNVNQPRYYCKVGAG